MKKVSLIFKETFFIKAAQRIKYKFLPYNLGWSKNPVSSQTEKLMAGTKFSDYLGLNHYEKAKKLKHFIHLRLTNRPQSFGS